MTTPISDEQLAELEGYSQHPAFLGDEDSAITMGELRGLIARLRAAEADAKRYRWLRDKDQFDPHSQDEMLAEAFQKYTGNLLDSSIDRAMERTP
ncbi:hypothetical protein [Pseudomonas aeruginosa]|uniref:hypothetical protein n=1 Tax=Pseudomonas aeruginosa TaxID=287 RepID=UPI00300D6E14